jgi:16S rRNA G966 N2-methylase RsmD
MLDIMGDKLPSAASALAVYGSLLVLAVTFLRSCWQLVRGFRDRRQFLQMRLPGVYSGERDNKATEGWLFEVLDVRLRFGRIVGESLYVHRHDEEYLFTTKSSRVHQNVVLGTWRSLRDSQNFGEVLWNIDQREGRTLLTGCWAGTTRKGKVNFGHWRLVQSGRRDGALIRDRLIVEPGKRWRGTVRRFLRMKSKEPGKSTVANVLAKHDSPDATEFSYGGKLYRVADGVFNPKFGKVSVTLLELVLSREFHASAKSILDWGTGCGFYAIELAAAQDAHGTEGKIWALESNQQALACARANVDRFGLSHRIEIVEGSNPRVLQENNRPKKFDLIIANLPFTMSASNEAYRSHRMFGCVCTDYLVVLGMCISFRCHLGDGGRVLLAYGESGDVEWLDACLSVAGLTRGEIETIDKTRGATDDGMYVFDIRKEMRS